jgi:hypothetical protein
VFARVPALLVVVKPGKEREVAENGERMKKGMCA